MLAARTLPRDRSAAEGEREGRGRKEGGGEEGKEATDASHSGLEDVGDSLPLVVRHVLEVRVDLLPEVLGVLALTNLLQLRRRLRRRLERLLLLLLHRGRVRRGELVVGEEHGSSTGGEGGERSRGAEGCAEEGHGQGGRERPLR
jgi:hypothetical protein